MVAALQVCSISSVDPAYRILMSRPGSYRRPKTARYWVNYQRSHFGRFWPTNRGSDFTRVTKRTREADNVTSVTHTMRVTKRIGGKGSRRFALATSSSVCRHPCAETEGCASVRLIPLPRSEARKGGTIWCVAAHTPHAAIKTLPLPKSRLRCLASSPGPQSPELTAHYAPLH